MDWVRYFPMSVGRLWRYQMIFLGRDAGEVRQEVQAVRHSSHSSFWRMERQVSGSDPERVPVVLTHDSVRIASATVLQLPLEVGAQWHDSDAEGLRHYEITRTGFTTEVPAGRFDLCVEVVATRGGVEIQRTVFAPDAGMVRHRAMVPGGWVELVLQEERSGPVN